MLFATRVQCCYRRNGHNAMSKVCAAGLLLTVRMSCFRKFKKICMLMIIIYYWYFLALIVFSVSFKEANKTFLTP